MDYFMRDVLDVASGLPGKVLVRQYQDGKRTSGMITEVEAYRGTEDLACHASKGRTARTVIMFGPGGHIYMYLIYGMYWMLNFVTGEADNPQAILIRGTDTVTGPGRLTREFGIDGDFYGKPLDGSSGLWVEDHGIHVSVETGHRIGVDYAGEYWASRPWRFMADTILK